MKKPKKNVLDFVPKKVTKRAKRVNIIDQGTLGNLKYEIYSRGVIHIFDTKKKALFKKSCELFENAIEELDLNSLNEDESKSIPGSGDNDTLTFTCKNGDIIISLEKPEYDMIKKLKNILKKGKKK